MSLYTGILHGLGLQAIDYFLTKFSNDLYALITKPFVMKVGDFVFKKFINFCFRLLPTIFRDSDRYKICANAFRFNGAMSGTKSLFNN